MTLQYPLPLEDTFCHCATLTGPFSLCNRRLGQRHCVVPGMWRLLFCRASVVAVHRIWFCPIDQPEGHGCWSAELLLVLTPLSPIAPRPGKNSSHSNEFLWNERHDGLECWNFRATTVRCNHPTSGYVIFDAKSGVISNFFRSPKILIVFIILKLNKKYIFEK